jgi:hypothetical protein
MQSWSLLEGMQVKHYTQGAVGRKKLFLIGPVNSVVSVF